MSDHSTKLPTGWTKSPIEELFAPLDDDRIMHQGWSPQCEKEPSPSDAEWGVLKTTSIQAGEFHPEHNKLLPSKLDPRPLLEVRPGDILLTCAGPRVRCGVSCLVRNTRGRLMISGKMYRFRAQSDAVDPRYLEAFLQTEEAKNAIDRMKTGSSESGLNLTHERFRQLPVPVAPLDEQHRIVAEIEKQFTRLEAGVAALRRVQANLKRYRAAVLKAACEGRLVPTEAELARQSGRKYETGAQLLTRILTERRQKWTGRGKYKEPAVPDTANLPEIPDGWTWATVEQLSTRVQYGHTASAVKRDTGVRFLRITDIQERRVEWDSVPSCDISPSDADELRLLPGDLVFARTGATVGKSFLLKAPFPESVFASYLIRISPAGEYLSRWLHAFFQSPDYWAQIHESSAGIGQPNVNGMKLQALRVPLPPLAEQTRIVAEVERRLSVVEELEAVVAANLQRATRLRQSILQKAFIGG